MTGREDRSGDPPESRPSPGDPVADVSAHPRRQVTAKQAARPVDGSHIPERWSRFAEPGPPAAKERRATRIPPRTVTGSRGSSGDGLFRWPCGLLQKWRRAVSSPLAPLARSATGQNNLAINPRMIDEPRTGYDGYDLKLLPRGYQVTPLLKPSALPNGPGRASSDTEGQDA